MRPVEPADLLNGVRELCTNRRGIWAGWAIAWTDALGKWFADHDLDTGERARHPGEERPWNGTFFQRADNENVDQGLLRKWRRLRVPRPGRPHPGGKWEVGFSLPEHEKDAFKLAQSQA
jgi:hypothetical protein